MKTYRIFSFLIISIIFFQSCCKEDDLIQSVILGEITEELDATEPTVRKKEALIGNLICDAIKKDIERRGIAIDFVIMNGGAIRFNKEKYPSGVYPSGLFTSETVEEMLPFGNSSVIVKVSGKELKSIFERSVAQLPLAKGPFLQVSQEVSIVIDTNKAPQVINQLVIPPVIVSDGNRISSIKIDNHEYDSLAIYTLCAPNFLTDGLDGYITFRNISSNKKEDLEEDQVGAVKEYIIVNSPVTPKIEGRIIYK